MDANNQVEIRQLVSTVYDIQNSRISVGNRLVAYVMGFGDKSKERIAAEQEKLDDKKSGKKTEAAIKDEMAELAAKEKADKEAQKVIHGITADFKRLTDAVAEKRLSEKRLSELVSGGDQINYIKDMATYKFAQLYMNLLQSEADAIKVLAMEVEKHPMWDGFFKDVRGCGPVMAGICLAYFDISKARHCSSVWKYAGLDVVYNGEKDSWEGRGRSHCEEREYIDKDGNAATRRGLTYNPFVKTKLVGVLTSCFIRSAPDDKYNKIRIDYLNRLQNRPDCKEHTKLHLTRMANRYMIKMFLRDMWVCWRTLEGYPVDEPYEVAKLGMKPHGN